MYYGIIDEEKVAEKACLDHGPQLQEDFLEKEQS